MRRLLGNQAVTALMTMAGVSALAFALGPSCGADTDGLTCDEAANMGRPCDAGA